MIGSAVMAKSMSIMPGFRGTSGCPMDPEGDEKTKTAREAPTGRSGSAAIEPGKDSIHNI